MDSITSSIAVIRTRIRDTIEGIYRVWKEWIGRYPFIAKVYHLFSWLSLLVLVISLVLIEESRTMLVQYLWSFYVLLQFWLLSRSKTVTWKQVSLFVLSGVLLVIPLTNGTMQGLHLIFGGRTTDTWSFAVMTPVVEEIYKLLPLALYLFFSRKATTLSLSDYVLLGAAPGIGFQFMEELSRRLVQSNYGVSFLGGKTLHWEFFDWFPGYFEESFIPTMMNVTHPVHSAMIALGIGIAFRYAKRLTRWVYAFPAVLLLWAILNHAAWNGQNRLPEWVLTLHEWTGEGYRTEGFFLVLLAAGLFIDYFDLHRIRDRLPILKGEALINPLTECWQMTRALFTDRKRLGYLIGFYRERRELGYSLLYGNLEAAGQRDQVQENVRKYTAVLGAIGILMLAAGILSSIGASMIAGDSSCFACLFDSLQNWWDRLSGWEQAGLILGAFALSLLFVSFWPALGIALTGAGIAGGGHEIAGYIRDPKKLLSPQNTAAAVLAVILSRIPVGKGISWLSNKLGPRARRWLDTLAEKVGLKTRDEPDTPTGGTRDPKPDGTNEQPEENPRKPDDDHENKPDEDKPNPDKPDNEKPEDEKPTDKPDDEKSDEPNDTPQEVPRYSGELQKVNKPDAAADALAERLGGESRMKFDSDPIGREFDAVSDEYIAQTKPALQQVNKKVRDQMKATFEAAEQTGRKVYYHFEGEPAQSVIDKLHEYSQRYGIEVHIDTDPL
ncbi:restriction endonuclease fold toxin [Paenibacillus lautus]|uniref:restriction endonuclease fold toxin n=1 Tax=Paenibacillus lautus TaxID=1401 RepID=UPI002DBDA3CC|nr:restriction endonuclease fold toxin [Paenibacillus lautus]MEC0202813.1 restriction endonuclease fold toxin [Paenibacillus lautus]